MRREGVDESRIAPEDRDLAYTSFVVNLGTRKVYIQSAFRIDDAEKRRQEILPLLKSGDFFKKIVVTAGSARPYMDENGIQYVGIIPFLLDESSIEW